MQEMQESRVQSLDQEDSLEQGMATHTSVLAWRMSWTEEPGGLQSMGLQRIGHDLPCVWNSDQGGQCPLVWLASAQQQQRATVGLACVLSHV